MNKKLLMTAAAAAILGLGAVVAEARPGGGHGGGGFGHGGGGFSHGGGGFGGGGIGGRGMSRMPSFNSGSRGFSAGAFRAGPRISRGSMIARGNWNGGGYGRGRGHWRHRGGRGFYVGLPYYSSYYDDYSDYGYGCGYLYERAVRTGSPYWWARYQDCAY